jgi:hypothetical protein
MIWSPDDSLWLPTESRLGPWYRLARRWRQSLSMYAQDHAVYDPVTGHSMYSPTQGGHIMYGCSVPPVRCTDCNVHTTARTITVTLSAFQFLTSWSGTGFNVTLTNSTMTARTLTFNQQDPTQYPAFVPFDDPCIYAISFDSGMTGSVTGSNGTSTNAFTMVMVLERSGGAWISSYNLQDTHSVLGSASSAVDPDPDCSKSFVMEFNTSGNSRLASSATMSCTPNAPFA